MLNHVVFMGRLTRDPELRRTGSGIAVANFAIAVDRDFSGKDGEDKKADFINCVAWRNTGEYISKYFTKGRMIVVQGRLEMRDWNDKDGNKRTSAEVVVENAYFGDSKREGNGNQNSNGYSAPTGNYQGGYAAPAGNGQGGYAAPNNGGFAPPNGGYAAPAGGYAAPQNGYSYPPAPASDFAMLSDDDAQLPF